MERFYTILIGIITIVVILSVIKRDAIVLFWGFSVVLFIILGYVRNTNVHADMKSAVWETAHFKNGNEKLIIKGTIDNIVIKKNSIYYYLNNTYISEVCIHDDISDMQNKVNIGRTIVVSDKLFSHAGEILCAEVKVYDFKTARNDGEFDETEYYYSQKIWTRFMTDSESKIVFIKNSDIIGKYKNRLYKLKNYMGRNIEEICSNEYCGLYKGILLGDKEDIDRNDKELYRLSGISHILAISGLHISLIGYFIFRVVRKISGYMVSGIFAVIVVVSYGIMVGGSDSVKRAVLMFIIHVVADIMGRSYDILSSVSIALLIMLIDNPMCLNNSGVILSFMAIFGITVVYGNVKELLAIKNKIIEAILISECINVVTRPVIAASYYEISLYSTAINIIVIPLMSIVAASGFAGVILSSVHINIGKVFIYPGCIVLKLYGFICRNIIKLPYATKITGIPDNKRVAIYYLVIILGILLIKIFIKLRKDNIGVCIKTICLGTVMALLLFLIIYNKNNVLKIQIIDVGQGDCICINNGREVILTDGGSSSSKDIGKYTILPFLKANGVEKVDYLLVSHSDADHVNGLITLMEYKYNGKNYVKNIVMPEICVESIDEEYNNIVKKAEQEGIKVWYFKKGSGINFHNMKITCISPCEGISNNKNELSMVYYLTYKKVNMIFTGDMGIDTEDVLLKNNLIQKADILKVGHHGSDGSSSEAFLYELKPKVSIISCGINNSYGHPGKKALSRLYDAGSDVYITAECGQIDIVVNENGFKVETFLH